MGTGTAKLELKTLNQKATLQLLRESDLTIQKSDLLGTKTFKSDWPGFDRTLWMNFQSRDMHPGGKPLRQQMEIGLKGREAAYYFAGDLKFEARRILRVMNNRKFFQNMIIPLEQPGRGTDGNMPALEDLTKRILGNYLEAIRHDGDGGGLARELWDKRETLGSPKTQQVMLPVPHKLRVEESKSSVTMFYEAKVISVHSNPIREGWDELKISLVDYISFIEIAATGWDPREETLVTGILNRLVAKDPIKTVE
jgi:hypothetical protein